MKYLYIFAAIIVIATCLFPSAKASDRWPHEAPDLRSAGANLGEQQVSAAWLHLPAFLKACVYSSQCPLNDEQRKLIWPWVRDFDAKKVGSLEFVSEKKRPELFKSGRGELHRLVATGNKIGSTIFVNTDLLEKTPQPLDLPKWLGILTHEVIHHLGIADTEERIPDQFAAVIAKAAESMFVRWDITKAQGALQLWLLNMPVPSSLDAASQFPHGALPRLILVDSANIYNTTEIQHYWHLKAACRADETFWAATGSPLNEIFGRKLPNGKQPVNVVFETAVYCLDKEKKKFNSRPVHTKTSYAYEVSSTGTLIDLQTWIMGNASGDDQTGTESRLQVHSISLSDTSALPGQTYRFVAELKDLGMEQTVTGCGASFTRPGWPNFSSGAPYAFYHSRCSVLSHEGDIYRIAVDLDLLPKTAPGTVIIERLSLTVTEDPLGAAYSVSPRKKTVFSIAGKEQPLLKISKAAILGAKELKPSAEYRRYYHIPRGGRFTLALEIEGTYALPFYGGLEAVVFNSQDRSFLFTGPLITEDKTIIKARRLNAMSNGYNGVRLELEFELPQSIQNTNLKLLKFLKITFLSAELQVTAIEFADFDFAVLFTEYVPGGLR